jgi:CRISPR-associated protein Cas6
MIDLSFTILGQTIPADHGYLLYASLSRLLPDVHRENGIAVHPVRGRQTGDRQLQLQPWSRLVIRTQAERIPALLGLAGKQLNLAGRLLRIGVPQVFALVPATALRSRLVTIKLDKEDGPITAESFLPAVRRQLDALPISAEAPVTIGRRRTLRIKDKEVIGFEVLVEGLTADESLVLQEHGLGGRRHMGCGVFAPVPVPTGRGARCTTGNT